MKNKLILLPTLIMATALAGCGSNEPKEPEQPKEPDVVSDIKEILTIDERPSFTTYFSNSEKKTNPTIADFVIPESSYLVGTMNNFKLAPAMTYMPVEGELPVVADYLHPEQWTEGWSLTLKEGTTDVATSNYSFDTKKCELLVNEALIEANLRRKGLSKGENSVLYINSCSTSAQASCKIVLI